MSMSTNPQYIQSRAKIDTTCTPVEDCRDYLRTGRCKYGASCKYNHPLNVQSGGGMKTPIDPSEPMFPIRPNEPVCQYYMKHGTCKFGQACKFHHPPQPPLQAAMNAGTPVLMNVGRKPDAGVSQLVLNPVVTDPNGSSVMVQFLPQRPDEPDCIFFLKNGRCKYGATCRYHHPINYHQIRVEDARRPRVQVQDPYQQAQKIHYVTHPIPTTSYPQGHVVVTDGPIAFVSVDGPAPQAYQQVSFLPGSDGVASYCAPVGSGIGTEHSSTSSLASSYDTAPASMEHLSGDSASALWTRARRNGSGGSLNAFNSDTGRAQTTRVVLPQSASDGNIARRNRTPSHGSASDQSSTYYDASSTASRSGSAAASWRNDQRPVAYENTRRIPPTQYSARPDGMPHERGSSRSPQIRPSRPPAVGGQPRRSPRGRGPHRGDEGFTMMTSALLNMLDTPEEASADGYSDEDLRPSPPASYRHPQQEVTSQIDPAMFERLSLNTHRGHVDGRERQTLPDNDPKNWSPTWQGPATARQMEGGDQAVAVMHPRHTQPHSAGSPHPSDVGLYLP